MYLKANSPHAASAGKSVIGFNLIQGREVEGDLSLIQSKSAADSRDLVGMFPDSGEKDVARAAKAASEAFPAWSGAPAAARAAVMRGTAGILEAHREKFARILTREIGMTAREAHDELQEVLDACAVSSPEGPAAQDLGLPPGPAAHRRPAGVCGVLATGSSPLAAPIRCILPALLCGNTVVWKPSDNAPTAAYLLLRAMMEAGLPPGVVNTVNGRGRAGCGRHFLAGLDKGHFQAFSFAGSATLGRTVGEVCGRNLLLPNLDLTGKGAMIVLPDADLDQAATDALRGAFGQAGQRPVGLVNILLHEACADAFKQAFLDRVASLEVGNPMSDPEVAYGPMINARTATAFREHWVLGREDGAVLLAGGEAWTEANRTRQVKGDISHGAYMQPCVWDGVTPDMALFRNQVPGPTVNLCTVKDFDEGLAWSLLGPSAFATSLYTGDRACLQRLRRESRADLLGLNRAADRLETRLAFTGCGTRPGGRLALEGQARWQLVDGEGAETPLEALAPTAAPPAFSTDWDQL